MGSKFQNDNSKQSPLYILVAQCLQCIEIESYLRDEITGGFPAQRIGHAENLSIPIRHHETSKQPGTFQASAMNSLHLIGANLA